MPGAEQAQGLLERLQIELGEAALEQLN